MTIEPTTHLEPAQNQPVTNTATRSAVDWQLVLADPATLVMHANVRTDMRLEKAFVGHIKDHGVLVPIIARRNPDGDLVVHTGHRRTLAAVHAGLDVVPVVVLPAATTGETTAEIVRIVEQLGENQHRDAISELDEVGAHQQLLDLGLSERQIARRTRTNLNRVKVSLAVGAAQAAKEAMARLSLTLDQAAVLAEFDDDAEAVAQLSEVAGSARFDHLAQQLRDRREEQRLRADLTAALVAAGVVIVDRPDRLFHGQLRRISDLRATADHQQGQELTIDEHATCPGHAAWVEYGGSWRPVTERMYPVYACTDWQANGHAELYAPAGEKTEPGRNQASSPMTEQDKVDRREVIANNKAWDSATTVRRNWLREFLTRRTAPKDAATFIALTLAGCSHDLRRGMEHGHYLACELLGQTDSTAHRAHWYGKGPARLAELINAAPPGRATMITLAMLLGSLEDGTSRSTWRSPDQPACGYFTALRTWGYPLSEVEQLVLRSTDAVEASEPAPEPADLIA